MVYVSQKHSCDLSLEFSMSVSWREELIFRMKRKTVTSSVYLSAIMHSNQTKLSKSANLWK